MKIYFQPALVAILVGSAMGVTTASAASAIMPDLKALAQGEARWEADAKGRPALFIRRVLWLDGITFNEGTIECDILGKSSPRGSNFPGVVFNGAGDGSLESVYFRPFNFRAENPENARHAVQYVFPPSWPWQKLRAEKTGQYEKPISPPPDGDAWFRAKIVVTRRKVTVFVNGATAPSLEVERLTDRGTGKVGITGGDAGDGGYFANLRITPAQP